MIKTNSQLKILNHKLIIYKIIYKAKAASKKCQKYIQVAATGFKPTTTFVNKHSNTSGVT